MSATDIFAVVCAALGIFLWGMALGGWLYKNGRLH